MKKLKMNWNLWTEGLLFVITVILIYKVVANLQPIIQNIRSFLGVISPFIIGIIIAYFLNVPCNLVEKQISKVKYPFIVKRARIISVLAIYLGVILIIMLIFSYIFPIIIKNILEIARDIPSYHYDIIQWADLKATLESFLSTYSVQDILTHITTGIGSISGYALEMASRVINLFLSIIISIYTLLYKDLLIATIDRIAKLFIKNHSLEIIKSYLYQTNEIFYKFISTQFLDACILGVLATIILALIGVKYAVTLGILLGICNMIPYFGSMFASIVTVIITFLTGGATLAIITGISLLTLQLIDGNIIGPRLMGGALNMNPILIIFSITIGGAYFGVIGMFLSIPIAAMLKIIFNNFIEIREKKIFTDEGRKK